MLAVGFDCCGQGEDSGFVAVDGGHSGHGVGAFGEGAGLVEEDDIYGAHPLQGEAILDEDPVTGSP